MIEFYTGVPGSGKTYRAVSYLYDIFLDSKSKQYGKFDKFYTNINEFKFEEFPRGIAYDLDFDDLLSRLTQLHKLYMSKCTDSELMDLATNLELSNSFFVIDEAHNFFEKKNTVLTWWLSYHRHLHQDIILITQNLALVESKYKSFSEFFYKAIPSSLRLFGSTLKYEQYIGSRMYKTQRSEKFSLKFNPSVYDLYSSGANTQGKKVIYKYVAFASGGLALAVVAGWLIVHFMFGGSDTPKGSKSSTPVSPVAGAVSPSPSASFVSSVSSPDFPVLNFICDFNVCSVESVKVTNDEMKSYIIKYKLEVKSMENLNNGFYIYRYKVPKKFCEDVLND